jgi:D-arabinose 1-dehydrogenase-like Zn-dependent alcohol dehydrogenase
MTQRTARRDGTRQGAAAGLRLSLRPAAEAYAAAPSEEALLPVAVPEVVLAPGDVLVAVELATLCEADLASISTGHASSPPRMLGHEQVGRIVACGPGGGPVSVDGLPLSLGDRVVWARQVRCGRCAACAAETASSLSTRCTTPDTYGHSPVRRGWELSGGVASHVHLRAHTTLVRVRDWVPASVLALASCATATAAAAVAGLGAVPTGARVLVSGCDAAGLTAIAMLHERGAAVVGVDSRPDRREWAREFGARESRRPDDPPTAVDALIEFTEAASGSLRWATEREPATRIVRVAAHSPPPAGHRASHVHGYGAGHLRAGVAFLERADHVLFARLVERVVPLAAVGGAASVTPLSGLRVGVRP